MTGKVDMDQLLVSNKAEKTIYGSSFGFVTIKCIPENVNVEYYTKSIDEKANYGYGGICHSTVNITNIYVASDKSQNVNAPAQEYDIKEFSFNENVWGNGQKLLVKVRDKYHILARSYEVNHYLTLSSQTAPKLLTKVFGAPINDCKQFGIEAIRLKALLEKEKWTEDEEHMLADIDNINYFVPKTKVFVDDEDGGEGEIIRLKEFCYLEGKALFEVKLYNGRTIDVNLFDNNEKYCHGSKITTKKLRAFVEKKYAPESELQFLNESFNEDKLNPFVKAINEGINIYWQAVENAAGYNVELYTWWHSSLANKLYLMEKRSVDRNKFHTTFNELSYGKYYLRVIAEDRSGNVIAVNKVIAVGLDRNGISFIDRSVM